MMTTAANRTPISLPALFAITFGLAIGASAQVKTEVPPIEPNAKSVKVEHIKIHGPALEGNLEGEAADRDALVFLPPSYAASKSRRYPVVYALHGYSIGAEQWSKEFHVPQTIEGAFAKGGQEAIVVLSDSKTVYNGSMYSSSVTTGDFENYVAHDVVAYMDSHYRTIPKRGSRGLVGHSMGGYGASRIGMKHADVFGSLYIMSPCCLSARGSGGRAGRPKWPRRKPGGDSGGGKDTLRGSEDSGLGYSTCGGCRVVAESEEAAPLFRHAFRRCQGRSPRQMGRKCPVSVCSSVHREFKTVQGNRHRCWRPGWFTG